MSDLRDEKVTFAFNNECKFGPIKFGSAVILIGSLVLIGE